MLQNQIISSIFYASIFSLPFWHLLKIEYRIIKTNIPEVLMVVFFLLVLINKKKKLFLEIFDFFKKEKALIFGLFFIFVGMILAYFFSYDNLKHLGGIKSWFFVPLIFSLGYKFLKDEEKPDLDKTFIFLGILISFISIFYLIKGDLTYDGRLKAFFLHPNYLAMFLAPIFLILFFNKNLPYSLSFVSYIIIPLTIYFTFSYNAWISIFFILAIYFILKKNFDFKKFFIFLFLIFVLFSGQFFTPKFQNLFSDFRSSFKERFVIYKVSLKISKDKFFTGIGLNNFQKAYLDYQKYFPPYPNWAVPMSHNVYLDFLVQLGFFGFLGFLILIFWFLKKSFKEKKFKTSFFVILFFLIFGIFDSPYSKLDMTALFWLYFLKE